MSNTYCNKCKIALPPAFKFCPACGTEINPTPKPKQQRRTRGGGSVYRVGGNRSKPWVAKLCGVVLDYFATQQEAESFLIKSRGKNLELINFTLLDVYEKFKQSRRYQELSKSSKDSYSICWVKLEGIHHMKMREIKTSHFQACINKANENGFKYDSCAKLRSLISVLCQEAMKDDIIVRNYSENLELPKYTQEINRRDFTYDEILTLFYNDSLRDARVVLVMVYSAIRISELFDIKKSNVSLDTKMMIGGSKTKAGINRFIPIRDEIYPYIVDFMAEPGEYLISSATGKKMNSRNFRERNFYPLFDKLGFEYKDENGNNILTPHRTRHTYISESIQAGIRPEALKRIVGHANYSTSVDVYGNTVDIKFLKEQAKKGF